ncbi:hypothetical protein H9Q79_14205 [Wansuia hejianensis]|uniref:RNase H type-1 domain-containing protein n=1 Tax=Wansuia hejianensis TaxID=2763667 RepID=A0A7G9GB46_9FIRM|nr:hypothetical protein H9Q79_14205 [Wansuia hejianensis]
MQANVYIEADSREPKKKQRIVGYVLESTVRGEIRTKDEFFEVEESFHGSMVMAIKKALARFQKPCEITIHAPDAWTLNMLESQLEKWAAQNFLTGKKAPIAWQKEWMHIWLKAKEHTILCKRGKHAYTEWMQEKMKGGGWNDAGDRSTGEKI